MLELDQNIRWVSEYIVCDICTYGYVSVHIENTERLECPHCGL